MRGYPAWASADGKSYLWAVYQCAEDLKTHKLYVLSRGELGSVKSCWLDFIDEQETSLH